MKNRTHIVTCKSVTTAAARLLLSMLLALAMISPAVLPADVFAANDSGQKAQTSQTQQSDKAKASKDEAEQVVRMSRTQSMDGMTLVFQKRVMSDERLQMAPANLIATGKRKSVDLSWTAVENPSGIDGYIILRKDPASETWNRIAAVDNSAVTYTDEEAAEADHLYSYTVVAYKRIDGRTKVSEPSNWAAALTTRSSSKNVYECKITNLANVVSIMTGSCAQVSLQAQDKAYTMRMRWESSNDAVATVDENGLVTGVSAGTARISGISHTGTATSFDVHITKPGTAQAMIDTFTAWMGYNRINGYQNGIIDIYNAVTPWPVGYRMRYSDAWCDATITAAAIKTGNVERIGRECSVPRHIDIFRKLGIWEEDGTITPRPGDIIVYSWRRFRQPNNASASHIGLVVKVEGNEITCIEGNRGIGVVDTRTIPVGWGCIRGYARPNYAE